MIVTFLCNYLPLTCVMSEASRVPSAYYTRVMYTNIGDKNNLYRTGAPACHTIIIQLKLTDGRREGWLGGRLGG